MWSRIREKVMLPSFPKRSTSISSVRKIPCKEAESPEPSCVPEVPEAAEGTCERRSQRSSSPLPRPPARPLSAAAPGWSQPALVIQSPDSLPPPPPGLLIVPFIFIVFLLGHVIFYSSEYFLFINKYLQLFTGWQLSDKLVQPE